MSERIEKRRDRIEKRQKVAPQESELIYPSLLMYRLQLINMKLDTIPDQTNPDKTKKKSSEKVREHLANERTYLAWMRSAISLIGFGVVIVRLRLLRPPLTPQPPGNGWKLGLAFSVVGLLTVLFSTQHYLAIRNDIDADTYEPGDRWVIISSLTILILGLGVIYYFFTLPAENLNTFVIE